MKNFQAFGRRVAAAAAGAMLLTVPLGAVADSGAKPLRSLAYSIDMTSKSQNTEYVSGFTGYGGGNSGTTVERSGSSSDVGKLDVNVVAATQDRGLVVDAAYSGRSSSQPDIRVAITEEGMLLSDPKVPLAAATSFILPLLARDLLADHDPTVGATWKTTPTAPASGTSTFTIEAVDGQTIRLKIVTTLTVPGPRGYRSDDISIVSYALDRLCPLSVSVEDVSHHQTGQQYVESTTHFTAKLVSDSMAKK